MPKIQMIALCCLTATSLVGTFNNPTANAQGYDYNQGIFPADRDKDLNRDSDRRKDKYERRGKSRTCRNLFRQIEKAQEFGQYRANRLEKKYKKECSRQDNK